MTSGSKVTGSETQSWGSHSRLPGPHIPSFLHGIEGEGSDSFVIRYVLCMKLYSQVGHQAWSPPFGCQGGAQPSPAAPPGLQSFRVLNLFTLFWGSDRHRRTSISRLRDDN